MRIRNFLASTVLLLSSLLSCEDPQSPEFQCYLAGVSASNSDGYTYTMTNGTLTSTAYGSFVSDAVYIYDTDKKLVKILSPEGETRYHYNTAGKMTLAENFYQDTLVATQEYTYDAAGYPNHYLSTLQLNQPVQSIVESDLVYENGNLVQRTTYLYTSENTDKSNPLVTHIRYDNKKNPYNTHGMTTGEPMANNPIEYTYENDPEGHTLISYTYNSSGYPVTYRQHFPDRTDGYADITGNFSYNCP